MGDLSRNFSKKEFLCSCCNGGADVIDQYLVRNLQLLRDLVNKYRPEGSAEIKIIITSGYRCQAYNKKVSKYMFSKHKYGTAADIIIGDLNPLQMYMLAEEIVGFNAGGIGIYPDSGVIHVDIRSVRARWMRRDGVYIRIPEWIMGGRDE